MKLPRPLKLFLMVNIGLTVLCLLVEGVCASLGLPAMYCQPFFVGLNFYDFVCFQQRFHLLHSAAFFSLSGLFPFTYPAPAAVVYAGFYRAGGLSSYLVFVVVALVGLAGLFARGLWRRGVKKADAAGYAAGVALLAFPFWYGFQRGNIELVVCLVVFAGLYALAAGRGYTAAGCFGVAASLKLLPVIYLGLFLYRRQYWQVMFGAAVMGVATLLALMFMGPTVGVAWHGIADGLEYFRRTYVLNVFPGYLGWDHSVLGFLRVFEPVTDRGIRIYTGLAVAVGVGLFFSRIARLPLINQVLCLSVAAVWFAPVSFEYTLMGLYGVFAMLAVACLRFGEEELRRVGPVFVMLGVLVSPLSEVIWNGVLYGGQVKCLVLGGVFLFGLVRPVFSEYDKDKCALAPGGRHFVG